MEIGVDQGINSIEIQPLSSGAIQESFKGITYNSYVLDRRTLQLCINYVSKVFPTTLTHQLSWQGGKNNTRSHWSLTLYDDVWTCRIFKSNMLWPPIFEFMIFIKKIHPYNNIKILEIYLNQISRGDYVLNHEETITINSTIQNPNNPKEFELAYHK